MLALIPRVHAREHFFGLMDHDRGPFCDDIQVLVGDHRGDFDDLIGLGHQTGHLQIDPDQMLVIQHDAFSARKVEAS